MKAMERNKYDTSVYLGYNSICDIIQFSGASFVGWLVSLILIGLAILMIKILLMVMISVLVPDLLLGSVRKNKFLLFLW